jgi:hypothetical protein
MAIELVYETHSISVDNERGVATGWLPGELSAEGRRLAHTLGERRRNDGIVCVFTSDLRRAVETAEIAFQGSDVEIRPDARLRECNYGDLNSAPVGELDPRRRFVDRPFPGGESYRDCVDKMRSFLGGGRARIRGRPRARDRSFSPAMGAAPPARRDSARGARRCAVRVAGGLGVRCAAGGRIATSRHVAVPADRELAIRGS